MRLDQPNRAGFTIIEVMVVGIMMTILAVSLPTIWQGIGQPSIDTMIRCQVGQEAQLAAMSLAADCGGVLPEKRTDITGTKSSNTYAGAAVIGGDLVLSYSDGSTITYSHDDERHTLIRDQGGSSIVIASNVYEMDLDDSVETGYIEMALTLRFRETGSPKYTRPYEYFFYVPEAMP